MKNSWNIWQYIFLHFQDVIMTSRENNRCAITVIFVVFTGISCGIMLPVLKFGGDYPVFTEKAIITGFF